MTDTGSAGTLSSRTPGEELVRLEDALKAAAEQTEALRRTALEVSGEDGASILEIQQLMLEDDSFLDAMRDGITEKGLTAQAAARQAGELFARRFLALDDPYLQARADDVRDLAGRIADILEDRRDSSSMPDSPCILCTETLSPGELLQLDRTLVKGIAVREGSPLCHTAILARSMGLPAVFGISPDPSLEGHPCILDARKGTLCIDPDETALLEYRRNMEEETAEKERLSQYRTLSSRAPDGSPVKVYANISGPSDAEAAVRNGADGVGLFRTEMLFLDRTDWPSEEEQTQIYIKVLEIMGDRPVVIRTLDAGADKRAEYFGLPPEENPALGLRAVRFSLAREDVFRTQLRAVLRASTHGNCSVMFPLITSLEELRRARALLEECRQELEQEGIRTGPLPAGIMIETPAAALTADELAREADFFSLGTNDLTQYTLAADRQNAALPGLWNPRHPAVLRLVRETLEAASRHGIPAAMCGELAADREAAEELLRMGLREFSVSPEQILPLRERIRMISNGGDRL